MKYWLIDRVSVGDFDSKTEFNRFRKHRFVNEKRLKSYPAVKICRFAVNHCYVGSGIGHSYSFTVFRFEGL